MAQNHSPSSTTRSRHPASPVLRLPAPLPHISIAPLAILLFLFALAAVPLAHAYCSTPANCQVILNKSLNPSITTYSAGDDVTVMMRVYYNESVTTSSGNVETVRRNMSTVFFPKVDAYSKLTVPNSYRNITALADIQVSLGLVTGGSYYELPAKQWYSSTMHAYIPYRPVIITLSSGTRRSSLPGLSFRASHTSHFVPGAITMIEWQSTKCYYSNCDCLDNMCPVACGADSSQCNIVVHLAWAGSDAQGKYLSSSMNSIYSLENVL
ncbi:hypothetical protein AMAG_03623 [Allomyces macrogynus ATCC 38327]|uniref:Uncharacterized protein n=1 Tax=Allomyces macrogynus (strain ATCC 38327) TaxID=578462 RepID=A0A0L0S9P8_ALLM3|nr:hypothetical protein AMAG_03623 [Allomyces macrogynus ATCC 38327]|eukprot:KNE59323.1 hypothetical protein AMAG_03623 [Allomyces macrogynus ATCC 38327]